MVDIATLGYAVDTSDLDKGKRSLDRMTNASKMAAHASTGTTGGLKNLTRATQQSEMAFRSQAKAANMASFQMRNLQFQMIDIAQGIPMMFYSPIFAMQNLAMQGAQIAQIYGPNEGGAARAFREAAAMAGRFVIRLAPIGLAIGTVAGAMALLRGNIRDATNEQVTFGDIFKATMQVAGEAITSNFGPQLDWLKGAWQSTMGFLSSAFKMLINGVIRGWYMAAEVARYAMSQMSDTPMSLANLRSNLSATSQTDFAGQLFDRIADLASGFAAARAAADDAGDGIAKAGDRGSMSWGRLRQQVDPLQAVFNRAQQAAQTFAGMFTNAVSGMIDGTRTLNESLVGILRNLGRMAMNSVFQMIFGAAFGAMAGASTMPINIAPGMANGGSVAANRPYVVGERGPELFVPQSSGQIVPNDKMGGGNIQFSPVIHVDARGAGPGVGQEVRREIDMALDRFSRNKLPKRVQQIQRDPHSIG